MSSILPFVVVALVLAVVASIALGEADQPATESSGSRRDPWRDRLRPVVQWCARSARDVRSWLAAGLVSIRAGWAGRRDRRRAARADRRTRRAEERTSPPEPPAEPTPATPPPARVVTARPRPEGVVSTALRVRPDTDVTETVGDEVAPGPGLLVRLRSTLGLVLMIALLGLALAVVLGALAGAVGSALDEFVN